jgi:MoaD family protein
MPGLTVRVKYLSAIRDRTGRRQDELELPPGSTLAAVAEWLARTHSLVVPGPQLLATLNGRGWPQLADGLATPLSPGDEVAIFPLVSGG